MLAYYVKMAKWILTKKIKWILLTIRAFTCTFFIGGSTSPPHDLKIGKGYGPEIFTSDRYRKLEIICKISGWPPVWCVFYRPECDIFPNEIFGDRLEISWWNSLQMFDFGRYHIFWSVKYTPNRWPTRNFANHLQFSIPTTGENFRSV